MKKIIYPLFGKNHRAVVTNCEWITDDPNFPESYWLWTLRFETPLKMYDGSLLYHTFVRRFEPFV